LKGHEQALRLDGDAVLGLAPHSLRAVSSRASLLAAADLPGPIHMHIAEQLAEVAEVAGRPGRGRSTGPARTCRFRRAGA
jgi:formimidoylglutamate deiminase